MINITLEGKEYQLDIEQAKKLNLLKEKDDRVRSWKEFTNKHLNSNSFYCSDGTVHQTTSPYDLPEQLTPHEAKALAAFSKLLKLRRDWIGEWDPDWTDGSVKYIIRIWKNNIWFEEKCNTSSSLSFPTEQMAREFSETFRDLIEEAKILI
jgi:hypothetical protein